MMGRRWSGTVHSFWSPSRRSALWAAMRLLCGGGAGFSSVELMWGGGGWVGQSDWQARRVALADGCLTEKTVYRGNGDDSLY